MRINPGFTVKVGDTFRIAESLVFKASDDKLLQRVLLGLPPEQKYNVYQVDKEFSYFGNPIIADENDYVVQGDKMYLLKKLTNTLK